MRRMWRVLAVGLAMMVGGCCSCAKPEKLVAAPPPISAEEQLARINGRAQQIPRLILDAKNISGGNIHVAYRDKKGGEHNEDVEGRLILRQSVQNAPGMAAPQTVATADIFVSLRKVGQELFRAGTGDGKWWWLEFGDAKEAYWGETRSAESPAGVIRPDFLIPMLGVTPVVPGPDHALAMRVEDQPPEKHPPENTLMIFRSRPAGGGIAQLEQEITINRVTGNITRVRLFDDVGRPVITSELSNYSPTRLADDKPGPEIPRLIIVRLPQQQALVELHISDAQIPESVNDSLFTLPDFQAMGLKVQNADNP